MFREVTWCLSLICIFKIWFFFSLCYTFVVQSFKFYCLIWLRCWWRLLMFYQLQINACWHKIVHIHLAKVSEVFVLKRNCLFLHSMRFLVVWKVYWNAKSLYLWPKKINCLFYAIPITFKKTLTIFLSSINSQGPVDQTIFINYTIMHLRVGNKNLEIVSRHLEGDNFIYYEWAENKQKMTIWIKEIGRILCR